jgi:translation initiation factor 2B subunit (eIF-2B alpha/beta/delta family)
MNDLRRDLLRRVRDNLCDGSSHLARIALESLIDYADVEADDPEALRGELLGFADDLMQARPNMAAIRHLVGRWRASIEAFEGDPSSLRDHARECYQR